MSASDLPALPPALARRLDQACNDFESDWQQGQGSPCLHDFLPDAADELYRPLLHELIVLDILYRRRAGECPKADDYQARFPALETDWLAEVLGDADLRWREEPSTDTIAQVATLAPGRPSGPLPNFGDY